ncbi:nucleotidyltransferase family protein [Isoptericola dokdonensis]|uniref:Nicotine blue oxidoreductase n=1 Tax=Isoptericola dokdonensis DS-3 TaxID=1300344 RepID=A0A168F1M4_9MICO|nr:nucleotidyltransferase family protein [Isoptericola dokdonensis]ANC30779.1 Nicotine blue oxidoreductase [Isoptericola dokdonensis DS-3]
MRWCGLVLAAGAGTRFGGPKGLARTAEGETWVGRAVAMLDAAGCPEILVAVGARADDVAALVPASARVVVVPDWADGLGATLRAGLDAAASLDVDALVVTPVDTPDAPPSAVVRVLDRARQAAGAPAAVLARAVYAGRPGHPVVIGRDHWDGVRAGLAGDTGAGRYLTAHHALDVGCGDLWSGHDVDRPSPSSRRYTPRYDHDDDQGADRGP